MSKLKIAINAATLLTLVFSANTSVASGLPKDENGFFQDPTCEELDIIKASLAHRKQQPTGQRASNDKWNMELYQGKEGSWSVLGIRKNSNNKYEESCILILGSGDYKTNKWYSLFFENRQ